MRDLDYIFIAAICLLVASSLIHAAVMRHKLDVMDRVMTETRRELNRHIKFSRPTTKEMDIRDK